jgi:Ca2+-binding RTX toxin-like protein
VRVGGGAGDDVIRAGEEDDHLQAGDGSDRLLGGAGSDGLLGGADADFMFGQPGDDLLAAGGPCGGGRLVGNAGDDNASFARTSDPQGVMEASLESGRAFLRGVTDCRPTLLDASLEDLEGTFGRDVLIGDAGDNGFFGQPGADEFYGRDGNDIVNARDGQADRVIDCEGGDADEAVTDPTDPVPVGCELGAPPDARNGG